jgi:hypothetical protein
LIFALAPLWGRGKPEVKTKAPLHGQWLLSVAAFDLSSIPPSRRIIGEALAAKLAGSLHSLEHRIRVSPEYAYYEGTAWDQARSEAGKKIADLRQRRDMLLYQGNPQWRYKRDLEDITKKLQEEEEAYWKIVEDAPLIASRPVFLLAGDAKKGEFPPPPEPGMEYRYCKTNKADGIVTGAVREYHGRLYLVLRLYTLYTRSYSYEDRLMFSPEDIQGAADEAAGRLAAALGGSKRAAVRVAAEPEEAMIVINNTLAGKGKTGVVERIPGPVEVAVSAEYHKPETLRMELEAGVLADLQINLTPLGRSAFQLFVPKGAGSRVYRGALFVGETPLRLDLAPKRFEYFEVKTPEGDVGAAVLFGGEERRDIPRFVLVKTHVPPEKDRLTRARRWFYGAYGRFWVIMPIAFVLYGSASSVVSAYNLKQDPALTDWTTGYYYTAIGFAAAAGVFLGESLVWASRYIYTATNYEAALVK